MSSARYGVYQHTTDANPFHLYFLATMNPECRHLLYLCAILGLDTIPVSLLSTSFTINHMRRLDDFQLMTLSKDQQFLSLSSTVKEKIREHLLSMRDMELRDKMHRLVIAVADALINHMDNIHQPPQAEAVQHYLSVAKCLLEFEGLRADSHRYEKISGMLSMEGAHHHARSEEPYARMITLPESPCVIKPPRRARKIAVRTNPGEQREENHSWKSAALLSAFAVAGVGLFALTKLDGEVKQELGNLLRTFFK